MERRKILDNLEGLGSIAQEEEEVEGLYTFSFVIGGLDKGMDGIITCAEVEVRSNLRASVLLVR